jgi:hypothetical protein
VTAGARSAPGGALEGTSGTPARRPRAARAGLGALLLVALGAAAAGAREIGPGTDLCSALRNLPPGDTELVLRPGEYRGGCAIRRGGSPGQPLVVRSASPAARARIVYEGRDTNALEIKASHVAVRHLEFGPTEPDVDGVRIFGATDVAVEGCHFTGVRGVSVVANHANVQGLVVRGNVITSPGTTPMYFGCHDGRTCVVSGLEIEGNVIRGVTAPENAVGYGIQLKLNATGVVRGNVIVDTKGPALMVYGATRAGAPILVEGNVLVGSRTSAGLVIGGGPVIARNNLAVRNHEGGFVLQDYAQRGLLRDVVVVFNTAYANEGPGLSVPATGLGDGVVLAGNAVQARAGQPAVRVAAAEPRGVVLADNVECSASCFVAAEAWNFAPAAGSLLLGRAVPAAAPWLPTVDLLQAPRGARPALGALERDAGPLPAAWRP